MDLLLDDVHAGDLLGHGVLDLQARVHLHEIELAVLVEQKFDRAGVLIAGRPGRRAPPARTLRARGSVSCGEGRDLDQFLVAALNGTVTLEQMDHLPCRSPRTWTSIWRGLTMDFPRNTSAAPNALVASLTTRS